MTPPANDDGVTIGEIVRRLDGISQRIDEMLREMREDRRHASEQYLSKELYKANRAADKQDVDDIAKRMDKNETHKRSLTVAMATVGLGFLGNLFLQLVTYLGQ